MGWIHTMKLSGNTWYFSPPPHFLDSSLDATIQKHMRKRSTIETGEITRPSKEYST